MELIDRSEVKAEIERNLKSPFEVARATISILAVPVVDPVHAAGGVYCRECENWAEYKGETWCYSRGARSRENDFCSFGEKKT